MLGKGFSSALSSSLIHGQSTAANCAFELALETISSPPIQTPPELLSKPHEVRSGTNSGFGSGIPI
jgi:hypothetical protein